MKKILVVLLALMALVGAAMADDDWGLSCSQEEIGRLSFGELLVSSSSAIAVAASIVNTAQVDYKNKVIKVWVLYVVTPAGRQRNIDSLGYQYNNYGYAKQLKVINLKSNTTEIVSYANYNCNGSIIVSNTAPLGIDAIVPGSIDDSLVKDLRKKFKI
jgi:uncharacterized protein YxeA